MSKPKQEYPSISEYALISDCHCTALVSRNGSIDWCCMPRIDSDSCFGRLLDWGKGGHCAISPTGDFTVERRYLPGTMVVETCFKTPEAEARLYDFFDMQSEVEEQATYSLVRIIEGMSGDMDMRLEICPRFDYGEIIPRVREQGRNTYTAVGGNKGLVIQSDIALQVISRHSLTANLRITSGQRMRLIIRFETPEYLDRAAHQAFDAANVDACLQQTRRWWESWSDQLLERGNPDPQTLRSTVVLKSLMYERTGAIAAAATTSLPEIIGESRNWDYRFSWVRDSVFTVRALYLLGYQNEAGRFLQFIQRSSAGSAEQLQIMYAVDGKRRLTEVELKWLEGYRRSKPVRIGNHAFTQNQLDVFGEIMEIAWLWHTSGRRIDSQYWEFLQDVVEAATKKWHERDHGIWEFRGPPRHFVHSKALCWAALDHGIKLAQENSFDAPLDRWMSTRDKIREAIEKQGYDSQRGIFTQAFHSGHLDASLLLLPRTGFIEYDDPRMVRTTDAICQALDRNGLLARYTSPDNLPGQEGAFLPCTFWLVTCLARQGKSERAWEYYRRAVACSNDVGLFSEEFDPDSGQMLGNIPLALTHVSQIVSRLALETQKGIEAHHAAGADSAHEGA